MKYYLVVLLLALTVHVNAQVCPGQEGAVEWKIWNHLGSHVIDALHSKENYPTNPDTSLALYRLQTPMNHGDYYGGRIEGFIHVPTSGNVTINVTADETAYFYLSSSSNPGDTTLVSYTSRTTNTEEHNKYASQTSNSITLQAGEEYYFLLEHTSDFWRDFSTVWWKASFLPDTSWHIISNQYIRGIDCTPTPCEKRGVSCDDGNPNTTSDRYDGFCNCIGTPVTADTCVGENAALQAYEYRNLQTALLATLYNAPNFPASPDYSFTSSYLKRKHANNTSNFGTQLQGYLTVPVTGDYQFNLTGDDQTIFYLSSDASIANKKQDSVFVSGWSNPFEHDKYATQTSSLIHLVAGQYYYFEVNHKQAVGGSHYQVFWKTPFSNEYWKEIPAFYTYDYACELACIPQNTACDDGNPYTNNDVYDDDCGCVGTPCSGADCDDPIASYKPYDKCATTSSLDNRPDNNWLSCATSSNPNPARTAGHWLKLDLGQRYKLLTSHIWNYNVADSLHYGMQRVAVDYSLDGSNWVELGVYNWPLADGSGNYAGFSGPDFGSIYAQHVLITSLDSTNNNCKGLGKVAIDGVFCPMAGTPCDDKNDLTINDAYDGNCNCVGKSLLVNTCTNDSLIVSDTVKASERFEAEEYVSASSNVMSDGVGMIAANYVELKPGFSTKRSNKFIASIAPCTQAMSQARAEIITKDSFYLNDNEASLRIRQDEDDRYLIVDFYIPNPGSVTIAIEDINSSYTFPDMYFMNKGYYQKRIFAKKLILPKVKAIMRWKGRVLTDDL